MHTLKNQFIVLSNGEDIIIQKEIRPLLPPSIRCSNYIDISEKEKDPTSIPLPVGVSLPLGKGREALKPPFPGREEGG
jgi:hypothetical protein